MVKIGQISLTKPKDWDYSIENRYSVGKGLIHSFSKQIHPQMYIRITISPPNVYGGYYNVTVKRVDLKIPHHTKETGKIPIDLVNDIQQMENRDNPYHEDVKKLILQFFKKYGKVIQVRT